MDLDVVGTMRFAPLRDIRHSLAILLLAFGGALLPVPGGRTAGAAPGLVAAQAPRISRERPTRAGNAARPATPSPLTDPSSPGAAAKDSSPSDRELPLGQRLARFIRENATWIVVGLGVLLAGILVWTFLGIRGGKVTEDLEELGLEAESPESGMPQRRFSSTKIRKSDVAARLSGGVSASEVETDREYALVVDEEALKLPPVPDEAEAETSPPAGNAEKVRKMLGEGKHVEAYEEYARELSMEPRLRYPGEVETALSERFMKAGEYVKAARILEHYVATHRKEDVRSEAYFNLGYIHFLNRTLGKARRFFKLFIQSESNSEYVTRAERILRRIEETRSAG